MSDLLIDCDNPLSDHPRNDGLVERWKAFPGALGFGTTLMRGLRHRHPGTLTNMGTPPSSATSGWGEATTRKGGRGEMRFDGTNDYVNVGNPPSLNITGPVSISLWVFANSLANAGLVFKGPTSSLAGYGMSIASNEYRFFVGDGDTVIVTAGVTTGTWEHLVGTYDGSNLRLYKNGLLVAGPTAQGNPSTNANNFTIGARSSSSQFSNSSLDDVGVYNRALSDSEAYGVHSDSQRWDDPTLSWIQRRTYSFPAAGGVPWVYHHINRQNAGMAA